jgi:serine/threonine-protein kinase HipA
MSLAGAQEKLPVAFSNGRLAIPVNGAPSTHILKPDIERLPGSVQNEALCMVLAKRVGMTVAEVTTGRAGQRKYLLVTRYDRVWRDDRWLRVHQEDFCQALGRVPGAKYEHNGTGTRGPGLTNFFDLARRHLQPGDILRLRDAIILNVLLTNVDSHSKNYSLLLVGGRATMAPLYDLMCAESWPHVTKNMAQDIAGKTRGKYLCGRHWQRMATACGINGTALLKRVRELAERVDAEVDSAAIEVRAMPAGDHHIVDQTIIEIKARCSAIKRQLTMDENDLEDVDESNLEEETGDMETVVSDLLPS